MHRYEIIYPSTNSINYSKPITALVLQPDHVGPETGVMLFTHGWGGNRFQHEDKMVEVADRYNLIAMSVEYRQSGYDFDPVAGRGAYRPYDASFLQVLDVLNGLRTLLRERPMIDRRRLYHYGGSQGGHIALLSAVYAPKTFAWIYVSCPLTHLDDRVQDWAGRWFAPHELAARDVLALASRIDCPIYLEYGDADNVVDCEAHARRLIPKLEAVGRLARCVCYPGGGHDLAPTTTKLQAFRAMAAHLPWGARREDEDSFASGSCIELPAAEYRLQIDWSRPTDAADLLNWYPASPDASCSSIRPPLAMR
ncbi:MAG TPA: prolyl oligopeptidase family serine peptidase [Phycisphaeraceae bacterium]